MRSTVLVVFIAVFGVLSFPARAVLVTWTLHDVTFDDGGTASGFVTFDSSLPHIPGLSNELYLSSFNITTNAGSEFTASFEYTPQNTDASHRYYVHFFSAPGTSSPRHGLPQRWLDIHVRNGFAANGGSADILGEASGETFIGEEIPSSNAVRFRAITGGRLLGVVVPEPAISGFVGIGIGLIGLFFRRLQE